MNWITLIVVVSVIATTFAGVESSYAIKDEGSKIVAKQLTLEDVFSKNQISFKEKKALDELKKLEQNVGIKITEEEITKKSGIVQELLATYDDLLDPSVMSEIKKGDVERAHNIVKSHTEKVKDVIKITPQGNLPKDGIVSTTNSLNHFIPKQLSLTSLFR